MRPAPDLTDEFPFSFECSVGPRIIDVVVRGYLDGAAAEDYLGELRRILEASSSENSPKGFGLLFKDELKGFQAGQAARTHGVWFAQQSSLVKRVAIVSQRPAMFMAVAIAALVTRTPIKVFPTVEAARDWLGS